jgi:integrase
MRKPRKYRGNCITPHSSGNGAYRYQHFVPEGLREFFGGRTHLSGYIPAMPFQKAEHIAAGRRYQEKELFRTLRELSPARRAELIAAGGAAAAVEMAIGSGVYLERGASVREGLRLIRGEVLEPTPGEAEHAARLEAIRPVAMAVHRLDVEPTPDGSLDERGLLAVWIKNKKREAANNRRYVATLKLFREHIGDLDYRNVTKQHIAEWRDHLETITTPIMARHHLKYLRSMFAAAVAEDQRSDNPANDVRARGKIESKQEPGRPFTGDQIRLILDKAAEVRFGGKRHGEVLWMLKLMLWTGARPKEISQLRKADVYAEASVPLIHIRARHAEQTLKTGRARRIPLHPAIAADFVAYADASERDFIFGAFGFSVSDSGRAYWLVQHFPKFLRDVCGVTTPPGEERLTLYSFRHAFHDAVRNAEMPDEMQRVLTDHARQGVHDSYGKGPKLKLLAKYIARVNPLADED